jgi:LmbE family N-acetylglucosaminyl deacetylase
VIDDADSILVVGAHAFDAEVIAGPLAATAAERGARVELLHLSLGEQGHPSLPPKRYAEQKRAEAAAAAAALGATWRTFALPDGFVPNGDETSLAVGDVVRELRPDVVITHWRGSWHKDHRAAYTVTTHGIFYAALPTLSRQHPAHRPRALLFGENWEDDEDFRPEHLVDVSPGMASWENAIREYELARGLSSFPYVDYYSSLYRMRGCLAGTMYAQAFRVQPRSAMGGVGQFFTEAAEER